MNYQTEEDHHHHHHHHHVGMHGEHHHDDDMNDVGSHVDDEMEDQHGEMQEMDMHTDDDDGSRRPRRKQVRRRTKSTQQTLLLLNHFSRDPKPKKATIKQLVQTTGLTYNEICRWFRNQRLRSKSQPTVPVQAQLPEASLLLLQGKVMHLPQDQQIPQQLQLPALLPPAPPAIMAPPESMDQSALNGLEKDDKPWRSTAKFRRARDTFLNIFQEYPKGSGEREQLLKDLVRCLGRADRDALQLQLKPRGPYRGSADPNLKLSTKQERSKEVWAEMERRFGVHSRTDETNPVQPVTNASGLDVNMIEGLKQLFKPHRDYLFAVARELEVTEMLKPEVENEVRKKFTLKQQKRQELEKIKREKRKSLQVQTPLAKPPAKRARTVPQPLQRPMGAPYGISQDYEYRG